MGATGVLGTATVTALLDAGHEVAGLARTPEKAAGLLERGADAEVTALTDHDGLVRLLDGADAVVNLAGHVPVGMAGLLPGAWRSNDRLRTEGVRRVVAAAREAGVRRIVQESVSYLYADQGDDWITENSPLDITRATEPASVAEAQVQDYLCDSRAGVVLRFGLVVGDDPLTRWQLRSAAHGRRIGLGHPDGWLHPIHTDDLGGAVLAALSAPSGIYNVGAEPVRRADYVHVFAEAVGRGRGGFLSPLATRVAGVRAEPLARSLRVSSERLASATGWAPRRGAFEPGWFDVVERCAPATP